MVKEKRLVPRKRFIDFLHSSAWNKFELKSLADRFDNLRVPVTASNRTSGSTPYYGANGIQDFVEGYTHNGEYILIAEDGANDLNDYPVHYVNGKVWVNNHAHVLKAKELISDNRFLMYRFKEYNIYPYLVGGGRAKLNSEIMMSLKMIVPSLIEQKKIGEFFKTMDNLINLQQQKITKLKDLKSAYLNNMFPKEGESVPKLRFTGFEEPWEKCKISDIFKITRGHVLAAKEVKDNKNELYSYPVYSSQTTENGLMGYYNKYLYENAITWTTDGANAGTVTYRGGKFYCTNVSGVLLSDKSYANKLIAEILNKEAWKHVSKVGNPKLMNNVMAEINITIPKSAKEQELGSNFFDYYDDLISIEKHKLEKLKQMKQAYLNEMFV